MDTWKKQVGERTPEQSRHPSPDRLQQRLNRIFDESRTNNNQLSRGQQEATWTASVRAATYSAEGGRSLPSSPTKSSRLRPHEDRPHSSSQGIAASHRRSKTDLPGLTNGPSFPIDGVRTTSHSSDTDPSKLEDVDLGVSTEKTNEPKSNRSSRLFSGLFQGESSPMRLGLISSPRSDKGASDDMMQDASPSLEPSSRNSSPSPTKLARNMNVAALRQVASGNPFSFFTSKSQQAQKDSFPEPADDKLLNLDIKSILSHPSFADLPPEEALHAFRTNAENVLREFQEAYKLRTFALHGAVAEKNTQADELEDSQSRIKNIKSQLDGMAARVVEQDKALKALTEELKAERQKYQDEMKAKQQQQQQKQPEDAATPTRDSKGSHSKQSSGVTVTSDSGFDSGDESVAESVFSRENDDGASVNTRFSTVSVSSPSTTTTLQPSPAAPGPTSAPASSPSTPKATQPAAPQRESAYGRVLKGISSSTFGSSFNALTSSRLKCPDCRANGSSDASTVTSILREENRYLKNRIVDLEAAVDECISLVGG
ncbi:hypothetical protein MGYG_03754 [Nannizzia gypsea CBS 118893]|uniref:Uncharacterized protein n=1 Tax=Arthroderma gypseum (strain ATCC MYA-4604 / CBS 118893) TaxID=535722 RepID=E4UTP1_ARTGP|nr:hypothetical protein MGYG_03754 [Nannizzia gypsea CBS 118893]EFR00750.1 hypothetical protein MGYG_03754 [Nannizzia gypsea CBS 118893]